jgi:hypothetical protein
MDSGNNGNGLDGILNDGVMAGLFLGVVLCCVLLCAVGFCCRLFATVQCVQYNTVLYRRSTTYSLRRYLVVDIITA